MAMDIDASGGTAGPVAPAFRPLSAGPPVVAIVPLCGLRRVVCHSVVEVARHATQRVLSTLQANCQARVIMLL